MSSTEDYSCEISLDPAIGFPLCALAVLYSFISLAIICDNYFGVSLERIAKRLNLSEDVAGATLMAAGSSAPEIFTSIIDVFFYKNHIGTGTLVGSAVFNMMVIVGVSGFFAKVTMLIPWRPVIRDTIFFMLAIGGFVLVLVDGVVKWTDGVLLCSLYAVYVTYLMFNVRFNELLCPMEPESDAFQALTEEYVNRSSIELDTTDDQVQSVMTMYLAQDDGLELGVGAGLQSKSKWQKCWALISFPAAFLIGWTVPDPTKPRWSRYYMLTFALSIMWIGFLAWSIVHFGTILGCYLQLNTVVMGLLVIATGTSIPDTLNSIFASQQGKGSMAVANAMGSCIINFLAGFGFPWLIYSVFIEDEFEMPVASLWFPVSYMIGCCLFLVLSFACSGWRLTTLVSCALILVYIVFVIIVMFGDVQI